MSLLTRLWTLRGLRTSVEPELPEVARAIAVIMDGNGRWASRRGLPVAAGHRAGTKALRRTVEAAIDLGVESLAVYAFSTENWSRTTDEVEALKAKMAPLAAQTAGDARLDLWIAFDYGGRAEIVQAARRIAEAGIDPSEIDENVVAANLYAPDMPDPDVLIRTSGELRVSNFLLWQLAYAELVFVETLWPDFGEKELREALAAYARRRRRFGGR